MNENGCLQFLDLCLINSANGFCWCYKQKTMKTILSSKSNHSKIIKNDSV